MSGPHVIVIGGGLSGLAAAVDCVDRGARVTLVESRARLGGATWSHHHRGLGFEVDNGQHVFMRCCEQYLGFLDRLGVRDRVHLQDRLALPIARPGEPLAWVRRAPLPAPAHLAASLLRFPALAPVSPLARLRSALTARRFGTLDPDDPKLDERSLGSWLRDQGESDAAIDGLWDFLIRPTLNLPAREASLALAARILRTGFLDSASGADVGWSRVPLDALHAAPALALLRGRGARVETRARVDAIELRADQNPIVQVRGERLTADAVVLATPHEVTGKLLPRNASFDPAALEGLGHSPIVNLHIVLDRQITDHDFVAGLGSELEWIFDRTHSAGLERGQYLAVSLSAADRWVGRSASSLRAVFEPALRALFPAARDARIEDFAVTVERRATFCGRPGTRRLRPLPGSEVAGVFLAGAWTDTGWPATMEGAVRSGRAAARAALDACTRRQSAGTKEAA